MCLSISCLFSLCQSMLLIDWIHYIVSFIGEDRGEKYLLVDWKIASMPIHTRGLGIRKLTAFN